MERGKKNWVFCDGYLPPKGSNPNFEGHEALMITNLNDEKATIEVLTLYWCIKEALFKAVQSGKIDFQQSFQIELVETVKSEDSLKASYKDSHFILDYRFDGETMLCVCVED